MKKPLIIITGKDGQLGYELQQIHKKYIDKFDFLFTGRNELDLTNTAQIQDFILQHQPQYFINGAAYTLVDKAETDRELCYAINATAVQAIATACQQANCKLIHISTDYVFDGSKQEPYLPTDAANPINYYGLTKLQGEVLALQENENTIIIRTSWVYSTHGKNFVKTMLKLMSERDEINVVNDQVGCPTYAADLAEATMQIVEKLNTNNHHHSSIYHYSNTGNISWFEFAQVIKEFGNKNCHVKPIPSSAYPTPAKRSFYSVMDTSAIENDFDIKIKDWKESLKACIDIINDE